MSLTGYLLSDGRDLSDAFIGINNGASLTRANAFQSNQTFAGGIDVSNSFLYGRNDGDLFNVAINSRYPVGFSTQTVYTTSTGTNGTIYTVSETIYPGKWMLNYRVAIRGNTAGSSSYGATARLVYDLSANPNVTYANSNKIPMHIIPIHSSTATNLFISPLGIKNVARVSAQTTLVGSAIIIGGPTGNLASMSLSLAITKLA